MQWQDIETVMHTLEKPAGGFTIAHRGIVTMPDGARLFIKIGTSDESRHWVNKEIVVYELLENHGYPFVPKLLAHNRDKTGFALEALPPSAGWDWSETWNEHRLEATFTAMNKLAAINPSDEEKKLFGVKGITHDSDGWKILAHSTEKQAILRAALEQAGYHAFADSLHIPTMAEKSDAYQFKEDIIVHQDVRADNCAWCEAQGTVKLVDWSWTQFGDQAIDRSAMLAHVYRSGFNVLKKYRDYLNADALEWLAGFWFEASTKRSRPASTRRYQLASGLAALELAKKL